MSRLIYNGIELSYIQTQSLKQEPVYSDDGVDYLYTKFNISVRAVFNPSLEPAINGETNPADTLGRVRGCLLQPRKQLTFEIGDITYISSPAAGTTVDAANGPHPIRCDITRIDGDATLMVEYEIETYINECCIPIDGIATNPNNYISNRWSETRSWTQNFYEQRRIIGKVVLRSDKGIGAETMRGLVSALVAKPKGWVRKDEQYTVTQDGLALQYSFLDEQVYKPAPQPAVNWEGKMICSSNVTKAGYFMAEVVVTLIGDKHGHKKELLDRGLIIALGRLFPNLNGPIQAPGQNNKDQFLVGGTITESLDQNVIEIRLTAYYSAASKQGFLGVLNTFTPLSQGLDTIRGVDDNPLPPDPGVQANHLISIVPFLQKVFDDPCLGQKKLVATAGDTSNSPIGAGDQAAINVVQVLPDYPSVLRTTELDTGVYTKWEANTTYAKTLHTVALPITSSGTGTPYTAHAILAQPLMRKIVTGTAECVGKWPTIPAAKTIDPNNVLLDEQVAFQPPMPTANGSTMIYTASWRYEYSTVNYLAATLTAGAVPFLTTTARDNVVPTTAFANLLDSPGTATLTGYIISL